MIAGGPERTRYARRLLHSTSRRPARPRALRGPTGRTPDEHEVLMRSGPRLTGGERPEPGDRFGTWEALRRAESEGGARVGAGQWLPTETIGHFRSNRPELGDRFCTWDELPRAESEGEERVVAGHRFPAESRSLLRIPGAPGARAGRPGAAQPSHRRESRVLRALFEASGEPPQIPLSPSPAAGARRGESLRAGSNRARSAYRCDR